MPVTIEQWYDEVIKMDHQWRVARAKEAFYGKVNQTAQRKPPVAQSGLSSLLSGLSQQSFRNPLQPFWWPQQNNSLHDSSMMNVD